MAADKNLLSPKQADRQKKILDAAAHLFSTRGYEATSMRDIAAHLGKTAGSIYYHFKSKDDLLIAIHKEAVRMADESLMDAKTETDDPWARLELACTAHLRSILEGNYAAVLLESWPPKNASLRPPLLAIRDDHEALFRKLLDDIPFKDETSRKYFRLTLFSALNYAQIWYRPHRDSPEKIVTEILSLLRSEILTGE